MVPPGYSWLGWVTYGSSRFSPYFVSLLVRSVTDRIGFSVDLDLHEKSLRRIRSRWFKNHVESDLYVFVSVHFFPFRMNLLSVQKHWVRYYMVRQLYKIGSMLHVKLDLNVLIWFYVSRFDYMTIGSDLQRLGMASSGQEVSLGFALVARAARSQLMLRARGARSRLARAYSFYFALQKINEFIHDNYKKYINSYMIWIHICMNSYI
jgi:hypothetical protein